MGVGSAQMNVCVQGLWHLGTVTAACLASINHSVSGLDFDTGVIQALNVGIPPVFEPALEGLVKQGLATGRLRFSSEIGISVKDIEVLWVTYDTPVDEDDIADVDYVFAQITKTLCSLPAGVTVLISSQMPVGSTARLEAIASQCCPEKRISFACSPENLRLGKSIDAFLKPDRIVVGVRSVSDRDRLERLLLPITDRIEWMSIESAEITKHAINAFLATTVAFANEIASICELVGADAKEVERGLKTEIRIGQRAYLSPGGAYSGGTLARDISFLNRMCTKLHLSTPLLSSVKTSNDKHKFWARNKLQFLFPNLSQTCVAIWGLTYKPGTDTLRRSMAVELCNWLIHCGAIVHVHDPEAKSLPMEWNGKVRRYKNEVDALKGAQALVIATEWPQYKTISTKDIADVSNGIAILDVNRFLSSLTGNGDFRYFSVGTPS